MKSADRVLDLLEHLAEVSQPPTFTQLSSALNVPKSSLSQLLGNMLQRGYVRLEAPDGVYRLGDKAAELARHASAATPLRDVAARIVERLRDETNESVAFYVCDRWEVEILVTSSANQSLVYTMRTGARAPLYAISPGKVVLAHWPEPAFETYLDQVTLEPLTPHTIRSKEVLRREVARARTDRFAYASEELELGVRGLAIAVTAGETLLGALNVTMPVSRYSERTETLAQRRLLAAAAEMSAMMTGATTEGATPGRAA